MTNPPDFSWLEQDLADRREHNLHRSRRRLLSGQGAHVHWQGRDFVNFSSNDYLNLAMDRRLALAAAKTAKRYGCGTGASPLITGHLPPLRHLESDLAQWQGTESALVFTSGFVTNLAVISTLMQSEDLIYSDELNHASLIEGCRLSKAGIHVYRHNDPEHLAGLLQESAPQARRRLIVTDSAFSMDGDLVSLERVLSLANDYDCMILLDEAHALGVIGDQGRGVSDLFPDAMRKHGSRVIKVGTLSKAIASQGGFVCGPRCLIDWLVNFARPYVFSTGLAPTCASAARRAIAVIREEPERRAQLLQRADNLRCRLQSLGWAIGPSQCHVIPLIVGNSEAALSLSAQLEEQGLLVPAIRPPSVPSGTSRLRLSLTAGHQEEDVERLLTALRSVS